MKHIPTSTARWARIIILLCFAMPTFAQDQAFVQGQVLDETGQPNGLCQRANHGHD